MDTMTQNTLADLRSMEHAIDDKKDRYLLGLCTLFVATIEDAKDRISQLELVFCCQLFPAFQNKLLESRQALQESEDLHSQALQEWQASREELLREIQELRTDRESRILHLRQELQGLLGEIQARAEEASQCKLELQEQSKLHKLEVGELQQELSRLRRELKVTNPPSEDRLREGPPGNEQGASLQSKLVKLSGEAADLRQENSKLLQENQKFSQLSAELRSLKSKMPSATPTVPDMSSDSKDLQLKLEQKSQERSLECFRRQLLSAEVEKERKATHAALLKLHSLKKRYQSLRKQYTVLFRHSHLSDLQKQAGVSKKQVEPDLDETADERYLNTNMDGLRQKCKCKKLTPHIMNPPASDATESAAGQLHEDTPGKRFYDAAISAENCAWQASRDVEMRKLDLVASVDPPKSNGGVDEESCRVLDTPQNLHNSEDRIIKKMCSEHPGCHQESDCGSRLHVDKASQVGLCSRLSLKVASHAKCDRRDEKSEVGSQDSSSLKVASPETNEKTKDTLQDSTRYLEALHPLESVQRKIIGGANNGWLPVQKRASSIKDHRKAYKSLKTTWRNTRSRAETNGFDPHDDFLDTPQENVIKSHSRNARHVKYEADVVDGDAAAPKNSESEVRLMAIPEQEQLEGKNISFSQVTTQAPDPEANFAFHVEQSEKSNEHTGNEDLTMKKKPVNLMKEDEDGAHNQGSDKILSSVTSKAKSLPVAKQGPMYKFVEPVRRKDEREKLQGIECNQCKKFYDAVLLNDVPGAVSGRCEHRDAVSRHRYRYVPPSTPEGFWNIGFDSEM